MRVEIHFAVLVAASSQEMLDLGRACSSGHGGQIDDQMSMPMLIPVLIYIDYIRM